MGSFRVECHELRRGSGRCQDQGVRHSEQGRTPDTPARSELKSGGMNGAQRSQGRHARWKWFA